MYKLLTAFLFLFITCSDEAPEKEEMLLGEIDRSDLQEAPYLQQFANDNEPYTLPEKKAEELKALLAGVNIKVFMGTWCSDSQRELPRFYQIMDAVNYPVESIDLVALDREKTAPAKPEKDHDILRIPTLIFYRDGQELGRIVEYPIDTLEDDMVKILSGEAYEHAYAN